MSLQKEDEQQLTLLFKKQKELDPKTQAYVQNKEDIVRFLWKKLYNKMEAYRRTWQRRYQLDESDCESLMSECLLLSVNNYDISKGNCKFTSFFWTMAGQIFKNHLSYLYAQKRTPASVRSGDKVVFQNVPFGSDTTTLFDLVPERARTPEQVLETKLLVEHIFNNATTRQKQVLVRLFLGEKYQDISQKLNISPSTITNLLKQLREKYVDYRSSV